MEKKNNILKKIGVLVIMLCLTSGFVMNARVETSDTKIQEMSIIKSYLPQLGDLPRGSWNRHYGTDEEIQALKQHSLKVDKNERKIVELNISTEHLSLQCEEVEKKFINQLPLIGSWSVFESVGDQLYPGFGRTEDGIQVASFYDSEYDQIMYTFSLDEGRSFNSEMVYWDIGGDYPSIKLWDEQQFHGTFVTDPNDHNGGATYLFTCTDPTDYETYNMKHWDWDEYGWYDMIDADIACNSGQEPWEWGVSAYVMSSTHSHGYTNGPTITFAHPEEEGSAYIIFMYKNGCKHCDVDIDRNKQFMYAVYDWENTSSGLWELLVWKMDLSDPLDSNWIYRIQGDGNLRHPAVAANDENIVILSETDESGNNDIICYYTNDGNIENLKKNTVVDTAIDEKYPDVRNFDDDNFFSTYFKNNNIFGPLTNDGGLNWVEVDWQINENNNSVHEEYKTSDLCEGGVLTFWEDSCGDDIDIFMGNTLYDNPPKTPSKPSGPVSGYICLAYEYFSYSYEPDGDNFKYGWDWNGDLVADEWTDWYGPNESCIISHSWKGPGIYNVSVKTKDIYAYESNWSYFLIVNIEYLYGKTVYVGGSGEYNYTKIQDAVDNLIDGFTIFVYDDSSPYYENIDIIGKSINLIGENRDTTIIDGVIHAKSCSQLNISSFTIQKTGARIIMESCNNCNISDNVCKLRNSNDKSIGNGILLVDSHDNQIINNIVANNENNIALLNSKRITIAYNDVFKGYRGIQLWDSPENVIHHNNVHNIREAGLLLYDCSNCYVYRNNFEETYVGINVDGNGDFFNVNNTFYYNNVKGNFVGVGLKGDDHHFYSNNFINNLRQVYIIGLGSYDFDSNYWNRPRSCPKFLLGWRLVLIIPPQDPWDEGIYIVLPRFIFDWHPAQEPYDI